MDQKALVRNQVVNTLINHFWKSIYRRRQWHFKIRPADKMSVNNFNLLFPLSDPQLPYDNMLLFIFFLILDCNISINFLLSFLLWKVLVCLPVANLLTKSNYSVDFILENHPPKMVKIFRIGAWWSNYFQTFVISWFNEVGVQILDSLKVRTHDV